MPSVLAAQECWVDVGQKDMYGSYDQGVELQGMAESRDCPLLAITWRLKMMPNRRSLLIWDADKQTLVRIHVQGSSADWESWTEVSKDRLLAEDMGDGFDFAGYQMGEGRAPCSTEARQFIRENDGRTFAPAL
jgi:hypothetical protein